MPSLILLNGPPGIGKSTIARLYADEHPGMLCCDIDVLRTLLGGWREDFAGSGAIARADALALVDAHLAAGRDVVVPQLVARVEEVERFERAADRVGADFVELMLTTDRESAVRRFHHRGHDDIAQVVAATGGDDLLAAYHDRLGSLASARDRTIVIECPEDEVHRTCDAVADAVLRATGLES